MNKRMSRASIVALAIACACPLSANAAKVFMMGGSVADNNDALYAGLRAATSRNWTPNTNSYSNCSADWNATPCPRIAVVTASALNYTAGANVFNTNDPNTGALSYYNLFQKHGFSPKHITAHSDNASTHSYSGNSNGDANIALVNQADVIFFNGGDQARAAVTFLTAGGDTPLMAAIRARVNSGSLIMAGTSAGSMIQGNAMFGEGVAYGYLYFNANLAPKALGSSTGLKDDRNGTSALAYFDNGGKMTGFGFAGSNVAVDTHCNARGRVARTLAAMKNLGKTQGICVDEDSALYLNGSVGTAFGTNGVTITDTSSATFPVDSYFRVNGALATFLTSGDTYNFSTKTATSTKALITRPYYSTYYDSADILGANEITKTLTRTVDSTASYHVGSAPKPTYSSGPTYPSNAFTYKMKFYKNANTAGYYSNGKYTAVKVSVDIY